MIITLAKPMMMLKQVNPACWDFYIDKEKFLKMKSFSELFQQHGDLVLRARNFAGKSNGWVIELIDPRSEDLQNCSRVFAQIVLSKKNCLLDQFVKPTFNGWQAIAICKKVHALFGAPQMRVGDSTTLLSCCSHRAPVSMRTLSILTTGRGWYQNQGAHPVPSGTTYGDYIKHKYAGALRKNQIEGNPYDYDKYLYREIQKLNMCSVTPEIYEQACDFFKTYTVEKALQGQSCIPLERAYSILLDDVKDVGEMIQTIKPIDHELWHDLLEQVVSNRENHFYLYIPQVLKPGTFSMKQAALAYLVLLKLFNLRPFFSDTFRHVGEVAYGILIQPEMMPMIRPLFDDYILKNTTNYFKELKEEETPFVEKIFQNTTEEQRMNWQRFLHEAGIENFTDVLQPVLEWLGSVKLCDFYLLNKDVIPFFPETIREFLIVEIKSKPKNTIKNVIIEMELYLSKPWATYALFMFLAASGSCFSEAMRLLYAQYRTNPDSFSNEEQYELWMLSKGAIERFNSFEFK